MAEKKVSNVIYILPILFGWLGGVIGYFVARSQGDQNKANKIFLLGLGLTVAVVGIQYAIAGILDEGILISPLSLLV